MQNNSTLIVSEKAEKSISVFENPEFGKVRTAEVNGKIFFCGKDVAISLGYSAPSKAICDHCKGVTKMVIPSKGGNQETSFISEGDVYRLIVSSKLPSAQKFESWVFDEVLPSIRQTGSYSVPKTFAEALQLAADQQKKIEEQQLAIEQARPKVEFFDKVTGSSDTCDMKAVAKILNFKGIGRNNLFEILRNENILDKQNQPYQKYIDSGYFRVIESKFEDKDGDIHINLKTVVFQKGVEFIRKTLLKKTAN